MANTRSSCTPRRVSSQDHDNLAPHAEGCQKEYASPWQETRLLSGQTVHCGQQLLLPGQSGTLPEGTIGCLYPGSAISQARSTLPRATAIQKWHPPENTIDETRNEVHGCRLCLRCFRQIYVCPQGKVLKRGARSQRNRYRVYDIYRARPQDCANCPVRSKCLSKPTTSRRFLSIEVDSLHPNLIEQMKARIDTPEGRKIYSRRLAIVEPVFANLRVQKRLDHFTVRSKAKVDIQWKLFALVHNIGKIQRYGRVH